MMVLNANVSVIVAALADLAMSTRIIKQYERPSAATDGGCVAR